MSPKMAANNSSNSSHNFFVDIHEVVSPKEESNNNNPQVSNEFESKTSRSAQLQHPPKKLLPKAVKRQVSLETGFSALRGDSNSRIADAAFLRSGVSFGGIDSSKAMGTDGRKGDFSMFRTKSSLSKQMSMLPVKKETHEIDLRKTVSFGAGAAAQESTHKSVPAGRYFAALRGAELDQVKDSEDILLPKDELWPFLLRFPIGCFGICLGLSSQAVLWRNLAKSPATRFLHIPHVINLVLWLLAFVFLISISIIYALKCTCYFEAVRREYFHPVRVNFFFAPWIVCMFLAIGAPPLLFPKPLHPAIWCIFMIPVFFLELKIYGQWLSGGKRRLCKVANPSTHLSVVGNFIGAILAAKVGWTEPAKFLWAVGFAHYLVVFVTLYQRLPTSEALPKELHPVYSMFIAAPAAASIAWESIYHEFDGLSRTCYFIALFLYISLVVRINFFLGFRFSVAWWAYTFPMTTVSVATIIYAEHVPCVLTKVLAIALSFMSSTIVSLLLVFTFLHAFIWQTLFPNDLAIAIAKKKTVGGSRRIERGKKTLKNLGDITNWTKHSHPSISSNAKDGLEGNNLDGDKIV